MPAHRLAIVTWILLGSLHAATTRADETFQAETLQPFLKQYCFDCHTGKYPEADLALDKYTTRESISAARGEWESILEILGRHEMPPKEMPQPTVEELDSVVTWIESTLNAIDCGQPDPGRVTLRRLNRVEYANTIGDLLGVSFDAKDFPGDDVGYGFDNIGDVLTLSPILMEKYLAAAEQIAVDVDLAEQFPGGEKERLGAFRRFVARAYRRPATDQEIDRLVGLARSVVEEGESLDEAVRLAVQAVLCSPHFLFRVEKDSAGDAPDGIRVLDEFELATRLSYFLWSSMPDDRLFELARRGRLRANLDVQVRRMLADPKSEALVENFAGQWLQLRNLDTTRPNPKLFPAFSPPLRDAMRRETSMLFETVMREDLSVLVLLDADFTFVNGLLAEHYGLGNIQGNEFQRVSLLGQPRRGLIAHASILTVTSNPSRTSPVKRGKWIMENILGTPPPEPPDGVPMLEEQGQLTGSLRQRMEQHRADPNCAVCHQTMDILGFALENYDATGGWRTEDEGYPIDPAGVLPDGQEITGPAHLIEVLRGSSRDAFVRCLTEKMLVYALGRGLEPADSCAVDTISQAMSREDDRFSALVDGIVRSDPFQKRSQMPETE